MIFSNLLGQLSIEYAIRIDENVDQESFKVNENVNYEMVGVVIYVVPLFIWVYL